MARRRKAEGRRARARDGGDGGERGKKDGGVHGWPVAEGGQRLATFGHLEPIFGH